MKPEIRISVTGFAEFVTADPSSRSRKLRPFKFRNKGEGAGRSAYYKSALHAIRRYHASGGDDGVLRAAKQELAAGATAAANRRDEAKCDRNLAAIEAYQRIYGRRQFRVLPNHRLMYRVGPIMVTAQPDLWVEEEGTQVLIKIGIAKKQPVLVDVMLYLIRKAAVASGYRVRARNVVYLDITNGEERSCNDNLKRFNRLFLIAARELATIWETLTEPSVK